MLPVVDEDFKKIGDISVDKLSTLKNKFPGRGNASLCFEAQALDSTIALMTLTGGKTKLMGNGILCLRLIDEKTLGIKCGPGWYAVVGNNFLELATPFRASVESIDIQLTKPKKEFLLSVEDPQHWKKIRILFF